jgi:ATP-dependent protease Clp ATPase subunit
MSYHKGTYYCSFCGKNELEVRRVFSAGGTAAFCDECVGACAKILREEGIETTEDLSTGHSLQNFGAIHRAIRKYMLK